MANVIDALVVTLGLDAAHFKKGAKETEQALSKTSDKTIKTSKDMEAWGKNAAASMGKLRNEVLGLLAVFTAGVGIKNFIENTITSTASLGRLSANLNMSAKDLAMWQLANKNAGGSVEGMTAQLTEAQKAVADYALHRDNAANTAFFTNGGKESDFKDAETLLRARADLTVKLSQRFGVGVGRSLAADMGISEDTYNLLKNGAAAADDMRRAQEGLAQAQANASAVAEEFRKKWDTLKNQFDVIGTQIVSSLLPTLNRFADWLTKNQDQIEQWANKAAAATTAFAGAVVAVANIVGPILGVVAKGWENIYGWVKLAGEAISKILPPKWLDKIGEGTAWLFDKLGIGKQMEQMMSGESATAKPATGAAPKSVAEFNAKYGASAEKASAALGVDKNTILGQWGLETGWGKSVIPGTNNLGNIKDFSGSGVGARDNMNGSVDKYRAYASADAFADDYVSLIKRKYPKAVGAQSADAYARELKAGGYAEDPGYVAKMSSAARMVGSANASNTLPMLAQTRRNGASASSSTSTSETNINGPINIVTQATDAEGIAKSIKPALNRYTFASQSNTGLS